MRRTRNVPAAAPLGSLPAHACGVVTNAGRFAIIKPPMAMFSKAPYPVMSPQLCPRSVSLNETRLPGFPTLDVATDMIMKQIFTVKLQKNLRAMALCLTALPMVQAVCTPVFAADIGKSDRVADPQGNFDNARYSSSSDWKITLGVGAAYAPKYEGSDKLEAGAVPLVSIEYGDTLSIDFSGVTVNLLNHNGFRLGVKGGWEAGRKEKDDRKNLRGMGDIKAAGVVGGVIAYSVDPFEIYAKVDKTIDGSEGLTATIGAAAGKRKIGLARGAVVLLEAELGDGLVGVAPEAVEFEHAGAGGIRGAVGRARQGRAGRERQAARQDGRSEQACACPPDPAAGED